jgi:hypothetical protein
MAADELGDAMPRPSIVMVGLGPSAQADIRRRTIHEFLRAISCGPDELVDGRAKHDHDALLACACSTRNAHSVTF